MRLKSIICMCLFASIRCFISNLSLKFRKTTTISLNQNKTPLIIYDSKSQKVISNIIENNNKLGDGNNTSVRRDVDPLNPILPGFKSLCKMNFVSLV